jgi:hypothetical protein
VGAHHLALRSQAVQGGSALLRATSTNASTTSSATPRRPTTHGTQRVATAICRCRLGLSDSCYIFDYTGVALVNKLQSTLGDVFHEGVASALFLCVTPLLLIYFGACIFIVRFRRGRPSIKHIRIWDMPIYRYDTGRYMYFVYYNRSSKLHTCILLIAGILTVPRL